MSIILFVIVILLICLAYKNRRNSARTEKQKNVTHEKEVWKCDTGADILRYAPAPDPIRGFANFPVYSVVGKRKTTNRKNTLHLRVASEEIARSHALQIEGLMEPLEISIESLDPAIEDTESGIKIPAGASKWDAQIFENCCLLSDTKHIPAAFMEYITELNIPMSWLGGQNYAATKVFEKINLREKSALYGYAVHCSLQGRVPGNLSHEPLENLYYQFADEAAQDIKICQSISKRPGSDIWNPSKRSAAYQFAVNYFNSKSIK